MNTTVTNQYLSITINPKGAELISLKSNLTNKEYIWEGNPEYWGKHSPILFPIVGALKNDLYRYESQSFKLPRHGFARDMEFTLKNLEKDSAVFSLQADDSTFKIYPFDFELRITYHLKEKQLLITYEISNRDSRIMPYSIGGHPAFALNSEFKKYSLKFESDERLNSYELEDNLLSNEIRQIELNKGVLPLSYSLFEKDALIFKSLQSKQIQILENNTPILNFKFRDFPNFGIWTKQNAPFICLEPWVGYADTVESNGNFMEKEGIEKLNANQFKNYTFSIEIL